MNRWLAILCGGVLGAGVLVAQDPPPVTFRAVDVFIDTGRQPLAAYQLDFSATTGHVRIISIEGGQHAAFKEPPYYDAKAIQQERAILAAFNTAPSGQLPVGKTRVATVHVQLGGGSTPQFAARIQTAADSEGRSIPAQITLMERNTR